MKISPLNILYVILGLIIIYYLYNYITGQTGRYKLKHVHNASQETKIHHSETPQGSVSNNRAYSIWYYISDWNHRYGEEKVIFKRGSASNELINVSFDKTINNIHIHIGHKDSNNTNSTSIITIDNVPLQRWTNLIVSINSRSVDVYLDGKLTKTIILENVPLTPSTQNIVLTPNGGFEGKVSNFMYYDHALNPKEAYDIYKKGAGVGSIFGTLFNKYRLKLAFLENNREVNSIEI